MTSRQRFRTLWDPVDELPQLNLHLKLVIAVV